MADLQKIVDELSKLTVLEAADLSKLLEEKWGVSAAAPVAMMAAGAGAAAAPDAGGAGAAKRGSKVTEPLSRAAPKGGRSPLSRTAFEIETRSDHDTDDVH